jgi:hypothetical protein
VAVADLAHGVVADDQPGDLAEVAGATLERPVGSERAEESLGVRADEAVDAEAVVEGMGVLAAGPAGENRRGTGSRRRRR